ncbi:dynein regulatory complex protein 8-like [Parasteatoda tepidariorum]|uniref:dynein regulatory complex protein 8-like n=1 Tax=Parasteatoda tepidariorum TaxID=114398 RepID=UPI0039BC7A38
MLKGISPYKINIQKQIKEVFKVFDKNENGKTDIKNVSVIVRALGRVPNNAELTEFINKVVESHAKGFVKLEVLLPALTDILLYDKWRPAPKQQLLEAFEFFDKKKKGYLTPNYIKKLLKNHGDQFDENEIECFLNAVVNPEKQQIEYNKCYEKLVVPVVVDIFEEKRHILRQLRDEQE